MYTVSNNTTDNFREKGSKFIGHLFPVESKDAFEQELERLVSKYPDATHHCYAWRLDPAGIEEFAQDDGEPSGSAGLPILNRLKSFEVVNAAITVVRYYGGSNLGKSGLIEAYGRSAENCLEKADLTLIRLIRKVSITYPYSEQNAVDRLVHRYSLVELDSTYAEKVSLLLACPEEQQEGLRNDLQQLSHRDIESRLLGKHYL